MVKGLQGEIDLHAAFLEYALKNCPNQQSSQIRNLAGVLADAGKLQQGWHIEPGSYASTNGPGYVPHASLFHAGEVWAFVPPTNQPNAKLTILRVENDAKLGTLVHLAISGISYDNGRTNIEHLVFTDSAVELSVTTLEQKSGPVPEFEKSYQMWRQAFDAGVGRVFSSSVADAVAEVASIAHDHAHP
jgi:hypothetical protein